MECIIDKAGCRELQEHPSIKTFKNLGTANTETDRFGALLLLNDYWIAPDEGFASHLNKNMDIITIPTKGKIRHNDSERNSCVIEPEMIQIMSSGKGICHSEFNVNGNAPSEMIKIGISPSIQNTKPWYDAFNVTDLLIPNKSTYIISPIEEEAPLSINQDAWISIGRYDQGSVFRYNIHADYLGLYLFVISGKMVTSNDLLSEKDGIRISGTQATEFNIVETSKILAIEVLTITGIA